MVLWGAFFLEQLIENGLGLLCFKTLFKEQRTNNEIINYLYVLIFMLFSLATTWNKSISILSTIAIPMTSIFMSLLIFLFLKCSFFKAFIWEFFYINTLSIIKLCIFLFRCVILKLNFKEFSFGTRTYADCILELSIVFILAITIFVFKKKLLLFLENIIIYQSKTILFISICEWIMFIYIMGKSNSSITNQIVLLNLFFITIMILVIAIQFVYLKFKIVINEKEFMDIGNKMMENQLKSMQEKYSVSNKLLHDKKYELQYLYGCMNERNFNEGKRYIEELMDAITNIRKKNIYTGNNNVDLIINNARQKAEDMGVRFSIKLDMHNIYIKTQDLCVILGNLLDNALEAAELCDMENRTIMLEIYSINKMLNIYISNNYCKKPVKIKDKFVSLKTQSFMHGWGIENVKNLVHKYEGEINIKYTEKEFFIKIFI